jgi:predicted Zn-dependent protease
MRSRTDCQGILAMVINRSRADETFAQLRCAHTSTLQFAGNVPGQSGDTMSDLLQITVRHGRTYATVTLDSIAEERVGAALDRAAAIAAVMPDAPEVTPFPDETAVIEAPMFRQANAEIGADWRATQARIMIDQARQAECLATGTISTANSSVAIATSNGCFLYQPSSLLQTQIRIYDRAGTSTASGQDAVAAVADFDAARVAGEAVRRCIAWRAPVDLPAGRLTAILAPRAMADVLLPLLQQFSLQAVNESRSFLRKLDGSSFVGSRMFPETVTLRSNPYTENIPSMPFTTDGQEVRATTWVRAGVIDAVVVSRSEARTLKRPAVAPPTNLSMEGGSGTLEELIAATDRAVLVHGFGPLSVIDPENCLLGGSTRDGLFLVENGALKAVKNVVFRETPVYLLKEILAMTAPVRTAPTGVNLPMLLPAVKVKDVMFTGPSGVL